MKSVLAIAVLILFLPIVASARQQGPEAQYRQMQLAQLDTPAPGEEEDIGGIDEPAPPAAPPEEVPEEAEEPLEEEEPEEEPFVEDFIEETAPELREARGPKKITIDMVVYVDYQFFDSTDAFKVNYHINMGGTANLSTALIKGSAEVATEVTGYLAKWPQGQCMLDVSIAKVPYEISYHQSGESEADINVQFKKDIAEKWESTCTFIGGVTRPFKSQGAPEKWIGDALGKTSPPISSIVAPVETGESTSTTFEISEYTVVEENLGSAKVKGTGIVTIQPATTGEKGPASYRFSPPHPQERTNQSARRSSR